MSALIRQRGGIVTGNPRGVQLSSLTGDNALQFSSYNLAAGTRGVGDQLVLLSGLGQTTAPASNRWGGGYTRVATLANGGSHGFSGAVFTRTATNTSGDNPGSASADSGGEFFSLAALQFSSAVTLTFDSGGGVMDSDASLSQSLVVPAMTAAAPAIDLIFLLRNASANKTTLSAAIGSGGYTELADSVFVASGGSLVKAHAAVYARQVSAGSTGTTTISLTDTGDGTSVKSWAIRALAA